MTIALVFCQTFLTTSNAIPSSTLQMRPRLGLERTPGLMRSPSNHPGRIPMMLAGSQNEGMLRLRGGGWFDYSTFGLSDKELKAIASLREKLGTILTDAAQQNPDLDTDDRLIRLLRVHDLNVGKTVPLFKKMLKWRAEVKADKIRDDIVKHFSDRFWDMPCIPHKQKFRRFYFYEPFHALDPKGDLVSIECTGAIRVRRFMRAVSEKDVMIFWTYIMEWNMYKLALLSRKQGRLANMAQVKDLAGLNFVQASSKAGMNRFRKVNRFMHECYPECLSSLTLINVPNIFGALWRAFRPLLPPKTISKIAVIAGNEDVQRKALLKLLPATDPVVKNAGADDMYVQRVDEEGAGRLAAAALAKLGVMGLGVVCVRKLLAALGIRLRERAAQAEGEKQKSS